MAFKCHTGLDTCVTTTPGAGCSHTSICRALSVFCRTWAIYNVLRRPWERWNKRSLRQSSQWKSLLSNLHLSFFSFSTSFYWQMIWRGVAHAEPDPTYLAEDHTDGPDLASWTHRQLGVMMHRMLPINRMYSTEASQADTPDRASEGGPAQRPKKTVEQRGGNSTRTPIYRAKRKAGKARGV